MAKIRLKLLVLLLPTLKGTFEDVYNAVSLYIPWYPTTGNHDWHGSVKAQIDYTQYSSRW